MAINQQLNVLPNRIPIVTLRFQLQSTRLSIRQQICRTISWQFSPEKIGKIASRTKQTSKH